MRTPTAFRSIDEALTFTAAELAEDAALRGDDDFDPTQYSEDAYDCGPMPASVPELDEDELNVMIERYQTVIENQREDRR